MKISNHSMWLVTLGLLVTNLLSAAQLPPNNPWLADSIYALGHGDAAQQDSVSVAGPVGPGRVLEPKDIQYRHVGPAHFGAAISSPYADGRRVFWSNGLDRIAKVDHDSYEVLSEYFFPGLERYDETLADTSIARMDESNDGVLSLFAAFQQAKKLRDLSGVYTLLDRNNNYYIGSKTGLITAYGDAVPGQRDAPIVKLREFQLPAPVSGLLVGMNMTFDGWVIVATEHGWLVAIKRDFSEHRVVRMRHAEGAEDKATRARGYGWVRNGFAIDKDGGIYIASQEHMHKIMWADENLSVEEADGAWAEPYDNSWTHGTGATPSLMGFAEEDHLVIITDGSPRMNVVAYWRDAIPPGWKQQDNAASRRIAGIAPVTMGDSTLSEIQSEQSVVVAGYDAVVVNNMPRNVPWYVPQRATPLLISYLGSNPKHQPYGVQKFRWNSKKQSLDLAWVNRDVSSPSCVPIISYASQAIYLIGARDNQWTMEAMDLVTGESKFHHVIGGQRYNVLFSGTLLDQDGRIHYGTPWGRVRLLP